MTTVYFDTETGGVLDSQPTISLAAIAVGEDWLEVGAFYAKIQFDEMQCDPKALELNHYDAETWKREAEQELVVVRRFATFLDRYKTVEMISKRTGQPYSVARLAGYNAATFDAPRLRRMFRDTFLPAHPIPLDVMQLVLWHFHWCKEKPENYKLGTVCKRMGIELTEAHDALADVRATVAIAKTLIGEKEGVLCAD